MTRRLLATVARATREVAEAPGLSDLTPREREVLALVAEGLSNDEIGARMFLSPLTVKTHVLRAMAKVGARDRAQLVVVAYESGRGAARLGAEAGSERSARDAPAGRRRRRGAAGERGGAVDGRPPDTTRRSSCSARSPPWRRTPSAGAGAGVPDPGSCSSRSSGSASSRCASSSARVVVARTGRRTAAGGRAADQSARAVLAERYARGEIDEAEYRARLEVLLATGPQPRARDVRAARVRTPSARRRLSTARSSRRVRRGGRACAAAGRSARAASPGR